MDSSKASSNPLFDHLVGSSWQGFVPYVPGKSIESLAREAGFDPNDICKLASNENPLPPSEAVREAMMASIDNLSRYPDGDGQPLKDALAEYLGVTPKQLALGTGSNGILDGMARLFLQPGQTALYSAHAFIVYRLSVQAVGAEGVEIPADNWGHDLPAFKAKYLELQKQGKTPRIIFLANPNNPTGTWFTEAALKDLLAVVDQRNTLVVLDEAYAEYCDMPEYPDGLALLTEYDNLVVTRTFSKAWGLAALRVGYAVAHPEIAAWLNTERAPFNVPGTGLQVAAAVLSDREYLKQSVAQNNAELARFQAWCESKNIAYIPSVANFVTIEVPAGFAASVSGDVPPGVALYEALLAKGVIARPVANYGMPQHLRISIGSVEENQRLCSALSEILQC